MQIIKRSLVVRLLDDHRYYKQLVSICKLPELESPPHSSIERLGKVWHTAYLSGRVTSLLEACISRQARHV